MLDNVIDRLVTDPNAGSKANKLQAYINAVNGQTGKSITHANAATVIKLAQGL